MSPARYHGKWVGTCLDSSGFLQPACQLSRTPGLETDVISEPSSLAALGFEITGGHPMTTEIDRNAGSENRVKHDTG